MMWIVCVQVNATSLLTGFSLHGTSASSSVMVLNRNTALLVDGKINYMPSGALKSFIGGGGG